MRCLLPLARQRSIGFGAVINSLEFIAKVGKAGLQ
jgi:hypothetical protein